MTGVQTCALPILITLLTQFIPVLVQVVIATGNDASKNALPARAGLTKLLPIPPNTIFTTIIENTPPNIHIHHGSDACTLNASNKPVTTAEKSPMVLFCFDILY